MRSQNTMQSNLIDMLFCTFRMYRLEILSSAATYKRMKTELLYWPRRVARVWTKLNLLSDHSPSGPMLDSSTGQWKGECLNMLSSGFTSAFSIFSEMSKCDNCYIPDNSNPAAPREMQGFISADWFLGRTRALLNPSTSALPVNTEAQQSYTSLYESS